MNEMKEYYLMHKDIPVCLMNVDVEGNISKVRRIAANAAHFPLGGSLNDSRFHDWWRDRAVPKTRHGAKSVLQRLGYQSSANALIDNLGLSLTDCYWIKPREINLSWKDVNLFTNDFVDAFGEININPNAAIDTKFSVASSQGELQKKWCIDKDGTRFLVKGNYGSSFQQSLNEVFAYELHQKLGFTHALAYELCPIELGNGEVGLGCKSNCICNEHLEMLSAWEIVQVGKYKTTEPMYAPLKKACLGLGMKEADFDRYMDYLIMTDYLLSNIDRHMNNIAILRDPDTLELRGFAPIYDSGNSMFYKLSYEQLEKVDIQKMETCGFLSNKEKNNLKYVRDRNRICLDGLKMDFSIFKQDLKERQIRYPLIEALFYQKLKKLREFQKGNDIWNEM